MDVFYGVASTMVLGGGAAISGEIGQSGGGSSLKIQRYRSRHLSDLKQCHASNQLSLKWDAVEQ